MNIKAEKNFIVAAASIFSRFEYIKEMYKLSNILGVYIKHGFTLKIIIQCEIFLEYKSLVFIQYLKLHFKLIKQRYFP